MYISVLFISLLILNTGFVNSQIDRIIGGKPVKVVDRPYQVALFFSRASELRFFCGGAIISPNWIITAAHCGDGKDVIFVVPGSGNICNDTGIIKRSRHVYNHPKFNKNLDYDVSLIHLQTPLDFKTSIMHKIHIVDAAHKIFDDQIVEISGYGTTRKGGRSSCQLMGTEVLIENKNECAKVYNRKLPTQFCAGVLKGGKDTCQGDSGGPIVDVKTGLLLGVTSFGKGCGLAKFPGIYTDLRTVRDWIKTTSGI